MHVFAGLLILAIALGGIFFIYQSGVLQPLTGALVTGLGNPGAATTTSTISNASAYYHEVKIQFVSLGAGLSDPMVVSLSGANSTKHEGITLTGWTIKTNQGTYAIPKVINLYSSSVPGVAPEDIYIRKGGVVNFYSNKNTQNNQQSIRSGLGEWRIWLNKNFLAVPHGTVILRDDKGKTVDQYSY